MSRFQFVEEHKHSYGVKRLCRVLQIARSSFYRWRAAAPAQAARRRADAELAARIRKIHAEEDGTYGSPHGSPPNSATGASR